MATLRELFTPEEMERFLELRRQGMSDELATRFRDRYTRSAANLEFLIEHNLRKPSAYHNEREVARLRGERANLFEYVLKDVHKYNVPFIKGTSRDLAHLVRSAHTDESGAYKGFLKEGTVARESFVDAITEKGPHGFLWDVAKSVVTTPIEGAGDIVAGRGWGEHPLEYTAKVGSAIPLLRGAASLTGGTLAKSGLRAATRQLAPDAQQLIKDLAKRNVSPAEMAEALGGAGFNRARAGELLQKAVNHPAWKVPARGVEGADILGAREEFLSEIVGELMIEGAVSGGKALYDSADPVASQQERRKAENDAAAEERFQRIHKPKIDAALDANALIFTQITQELAARKTDLSPEEIANISDEDFVMAFENQVAPQVQAEIDALEAAGLENAGDVLRARMLQLHQQARQPAEPEGDVQPDTDTTQTAPDTEDTLQSAVDALVTIARRDFTNLDPATATNKAIEQQFGTNFGIYSIDQQTEIRSRVKSELQGDADATQPDQPETAAAPATETETDTDETEAADPQTVPEETDAPPQEETEPVELTPEELEAQAEQEAIAIVSSTARPNTYVIENALESLSEPVDAETFLSMFGDKMPQVYRDNPRAMDILLNLLVEDSDSRVVSADPTEAGVRQYTAEAAVDTVPDTQKGTETTAYMTDATPYKVRPVVRELDELIPSHDIEGNETPDYPADLQPREGRESQISSDVTRENASKLIPSLSLDFPIQFDKGPPLTSKRYPGRTVAGTGRTNMLKWARDHHPEKWQAYQDALREQVEALGIDPAVLDNMQSPVLHYELTENVDEIEIAKDTNVQTTLDNTATETAGQDADYFDDNLMALWQPGEGSFEDALKSEGNQPFRTALFNRIPKHLVSGFMTADNANFSADGIKRIQNAMIRYVFGGEIGDRLSKTFIETGIEDLKNIDTMLRNIVATLAYAKANGQDIGPELASAIFRFIEFNNRANADTRRIPKDVLLYAEIDALYRTKTTVDAPSLLEKQLLYLLYAKRGTPRQLAGDFQTWAERAAGLSTTEQTDFISGDTAPTAANSETIFAGIIEDYINATVFETRETQDGTTELLPPESMPPELVDMREDMDKLPTTEDKQSFVSAWIQNFLEVMNEGEPLTQGDTDATATPEATTDNQQDTGTGPAERSTTGADTDTSAGPDTSEQPGDDSSESGQPDAEDDGDPGATGDVESDATPEDVGQTVDTSELEQALEIAFVGTVSLDKWNAAEPKGKRSSLQRQEQSIPVHLQTGAITAEEAEQKREAIEFLRRSIDEGETTTAPAEPETPSIETALATVFTSGKITLEAWNAYTDAEKQHSLQNALDSLPALRSAGVLTTEGVAERRAAVEVLRRGIEEDTDVDADNTTETDQESVGVDTETERSPQQPSSGAGTPTDTNQLVAINRRTDESSPTEFPPEIQSALTQVGISIDEWQAALEVGNALEILNSLATADTNLDNVEAITTLHQSLDDRADPTAEEMQTETEVDVDEEFDDDFDDDLLGEVQPNKLRDITDEQRSDFETVRRKLFLAKTIARLESKTDRSLEETLQLAALKSTQRNDAQQEIYNDLLTRFIDRQVTRLQAKTERSTTEERVLSALTAVQAEGIPDEASDLSLYSDLDTPDQEHSSPLAETRTLAGVQAPDTSDTEVDLPDDVTADTSKLSPAQLTSVKAILAAFKRKIHTSTDTTVQGGFLLADKPGVGKTRQALAILWHYMRQGISKHFVLAPNEQLLNNYVTDMDAMGGPAADISKYDSSNAKPTTPVATGTYSTLIRKPDLAAFNTTAGNQNAIADIIEHLTGVRPILRQTHPTVHKAMTEAFARIGIHNVAGATDAEIVDNAVTELRNQAKRVNLESPGNVEQFRQRVTPALADILLNERQGGGTQLHIGGGSDLHSTVAQLLTFAQTHISAEPDPDFAAAAENFEGVIVMDEMHKAAGRNQTGQMVGMLDQLLPNAKFLYMSATPFKEIANFFVASRLGLWGANQAFPSFGRFSDTFKRAVRAVKEIIPLHLKQAGRYISRALSARETRYTPVEIPLTDTEKAQYDTAVQFVNTIRQRFEASIDEALRTAWGNTLEEEKAFHRYKAKYMRMFYNQTQKFFLAVLDSMKAQGLSEQIQEQLKNGDKIIVQLENTWDQTAENARRRGTTPGPFELLIDFVENENLFPVHVHIPEVRQRRDGKEYTVPVKAMTYENGKEVPVPDPQLKQIQTQFLELLKNEMRQNQNIGELPFAADIIHAAAEAVGVNSGEISGRETDTQKRIQMSKDFSETTNLNLMVLGPAGLTGINLPVSEKIKDQVKNLYHYLVQSSWNVNTFEQGLGRGKRANSAIDPHYIIAHQDLPGADRVLGATLAKFAEMGALAGQADSALMQNVDKVEGETNLDDDPEADVDADEVFDEDTPGEKGFVFGKHGEDALEQLWFDLYNSGDMRIPDTLGLPHPEMAGGTGFLDPDTVPSVKQFFQRLLHQPTNIQPDFYREFEDRLKRIIAHNKELGTLDTGATDFNATDGQILDRLNIYTDPDTGKTAEMVKLSIRRRLPRRSWEFLEKVRNQAPGYEQYGGDRFTGFYTDADGHIWAIIENPYADGETEYIRWGPRGTPISENRVTTTQLADDFTPVADADAQQLWETEDADSDTHVDSEIFMATGMMLPKWQDLGTGRYDHPVMAVIAMADGSKLHGRVISPAQLSTVLEKVGGVDPNYFDPENRAEAPPLPEDPEIDIPALVREIVGEATDPQIRNRIEGIVEHIHQKLPLKLRGHLVRSAQEAAILGQLIRDPQVEHVWIVYRREGRIMKIEPMSLNRKGEADAGDFEHIKGEAGRWHADAVLRIHNHPSGVARWSQADKNVAMDWHSQLGTLMAEDIIVDSGTFAYRTFENGKYTWHEDVSLNPKSADWDTTAAPTQDNAGELRPDDPLYQNPLIRGAREAATYMWGLKRDMSVAEIVFVSKKDGKIIETITDPKLRSEPDPAAYMETLLRPRRDQLQAHVMLWGEDADTAARAVENVDGVDSVWVGSQRITGMDHTRTSSDQTITDTSTDDTRSEGDKQADALLEHILVQTITDTEAAEASVDVDTNLEAPQAAHIVQSDQVKRGLESFNERYRQEKRKRGSRWTPKQKVQEARISEDRTILVKLDKNDQWTPIVRTIDGKDYYMTPYTPQGSKWKIAEHIVNWRGGTKKGTYFSLLARGELQSTAEDLATGDIDSSRNAAGWDALTDNKNYIFLAPSDKSYRQINLGKALGFFFDAEWLVRNGATVGTKDSIEFYDRIIKNVLSKALYPAHIGRRAMFTRGRVSREDILAYIRNDTAHLKGKDDKDMAVIQQAYQDIQKQLPKVSQQFRFTGDKAIQLLRQGRAREILVPNRLSHDGLLGIIEGGKHFQLVEPTSVELKTPGILKQIANRIKGAFSDTTTEQTGDNTLQEYQPSAETPYINRATRAMPPKDTLTMQGKGRSRRWLSPQSQLFSKLRLWTPKLRKQSRMIANAMRSGYGKLSELKAPYDAEKPAPGDIIEDMLDQRMHISQVWTGRARSVLMPVLKKLNAQVKREGREDSKARRAAVDFDIINFIEYNTALPKRSAAYQAVAEELKEAWRKVNQSFVEAMIGQIRDIGHREDITKVGTRGRQKWGPEPMGGMQWKWEAAGGQGRYIDKQGTEYTIAEAFARTEQLWYPHQYDRSRLRDYNRKLEALVKGLNELIAAGDNASEDAFKAAGITKVDGGYRHNRVSGVFPDLDAVVNFYTEIRDRTATLLKYMEDGTIGLYPHLERVRETHDRLYKRDTNILMSTTALLWDRFAEIATFGQIDPYGELPPRLATLLQTVDHYNANDREAALMAVIDGLQERNRSEESLAEDDRHWGMHESIPAFEGGEAAALRIMQQWEDYIIDKDGNKVKTGKWKGIDINRLELDGKTLNTLETIGFIEREGDGWKVRGKTDAAQQTTIARFFVELMQTKADRRKRIQGLIQALGHWQQKDPLHEGSDELWRRANTMISIGALGWKQALQNLTEVPTIAMMAGLKSTAGLVKEMRDPEFRAAAEELAQGLKQGVEFLADDNLQEKYLQSAWSMFGWTERTSRMLGVGAGLIRAKTLSKELLASQEGSKNRARIEREMRSLRMNPAVILEMAPGEVDTIYDEAIARIKSQDIALAGVELPSKTPAKHRLTDRIGEEWVRTAMYISDSVFKPYDARTLPAEFQKSTPFARMILKFKGWMFQQNRFMVDQYKRAAVEARQGNYRPIARILTATLMLTGSVGAAQAVFAMLQGRDENDDELLRAYLHTQTLGLGSVLWEMAVRSEGNPWRLEKSMEGTLVGPVFGVFADVLAPTATGDWDRSLQEVLQRTPVAREAIHLGVNKWWEDEE